ncbi:MAG: hypothetical protein JW841_03625 [Deltaproteobacteria bacterium]|nr:hypothetical protein [Deltaproteobacteria bacterium]
MRAQVPGNFHGLPAQISAMYAPEISAMRDEVQMDVVDH